MKRCKGQYSKDEKVPSMDNKLTNKLLHQQPTELTLSAVTAATEASWLKPFSNASKQKACLN